MQKVWSRVWIRVAAFFTYNDNHYIHKGMSRVFLFYHVILYRYIIAIDWLDFSFPFDGYE